MADETFHSDRVRWLNPECAASMYTGSVRNPRTRDVFYDWQKERMGLGFHLRWWKGLWSRLVWEVEDWWEDYRDAMP